MISFNLPPWNVISKWLLSILGAITTFLSNRSYNIGDKLEDGSIVFAVKDSGKHGKAAWPVDDTPSSWDVAKVVVSTHGSGWDLPQNNELDLLYIQHGVVGCLTVNRYWSSTESDSNNAYAKDFGDGSYLIFKKDYTNCVRAVRDF